MTPYSSYNLILTMFVLPLSFLLAGSSNRLGNLLLSGRVALLVMLLGYPWDFFAIHLGVWNYPGNPGYRIYGVPINDLWFMWLCTHLACCFLIAIRRRYARGDGDPKSKNASKKDT